MANVRKNFGLVTDYKQISASLTTKILGGTISTLTPSGYWLPLSHPPAEKCFKSALNKLMPICSKMIIEQENCMACKKAWVLHAKMMIRMAKNRKAAAKTRSKRLKALRELKKEHQKLLDQTKALDDELAKQRQQINSIREGTKKKVKDRDILKIISYLHSE